MSSNNQAKFLIWLSMLLIIVTTVIYIINIDPWVDIMGNAVICITAIFASIMVFVVSVQLHGVEKKFWIWLGIGISLWTIAEILWAVFEVILGIELPYPSLADLFWIIGYIPVFAAFWLQFRLVFIKDGKREFFVIFLAALLLAAMLLSMRPILAADLEPLEKFFDIAYPSLDFVLFGLALYGFSIFKPRISLAFALICIGMLLMTIADLAFSYFTWQEIYEEWPYFLIDIPYVLAYWFLLLASSSYLSSIQKLKTKLR